MKKLFQKDFYASWSDMDFNAHMRNTAYLDKSADSRMLFFSENGFPMSEFLRIKIGPVIVKDEIEYFREVNLLEHMKVTLSIQGLSDDGRRWMMKNEFFNSDGKLLARVLSSGVWLDLSNRKIVSAPDKLLGTLNLLSKTDDFQVLEPRTKK